MKEDKTRVWRLNRAARERFKHFEYEHRRAVTGTKMSVAEGKKNDFLKSIITSSLRHKNLKNKVRDGFCFILSAANVKAESYIRSTISEFLWLYMKANKSVKLLLPAGKSLLVSELWALSSGLVMLVCGDLICYWVDFVSRITDLQLQVTCGVCVFKSSFHQLKMINYMFWYWK